MRDWDFKGKGSWWVPSSKILPAAFSDLPWFLTLGAVLHESYYTQ